MRHTGVAAYRCSLPVLAGFTVFRCARPNPRRGIAYRTTRVTPEASLEASLLMRTRLFSRFRPAGALVTLALLMAAPGSAAGRLPYQTALLGGNLTPAAIAQSCRTQIALAKTRMDAIAHRAGPRTFGNVIAAIENVEADLSDNTAAAQFVFQVSGDAAVRNASQQCGSDESSFFAFESARPDLYAALVAARASRTAKRSPSANCKNSPSRAPALRRGPHGAATA